MPMPPQFMKKAGNAAEDKLDGGKDDASEMPSKKGTLKKKHKGGKGNIPPALAAAIQRRMGK